MPPESVCFSFFYLECRYFLSAPFSIRGDVSRGLVSFRTCMERPCKGTWMPAYKCVWKQFRCPHGGSIQAHGKGASNRAGSQHPSKVGWKGIFRNDFSRSVLKNCPCNAGCCLRWKAANSAGGVRENALKARVIIDAVKKRFPGEGISMFCSEEVEPQ